MSLTLLGILNAQAAGEGAGAFDLLETTTLTTSASSVTFSGLGAYSDYKHLQIRVSLRSTISSNESNGRIRFNGDTTTSNYRSHLLAAGTSLTGVISTTVTGQSGVYLDGFLTGATSPANSFSAGVIDVLDAFSTTKYTTIRSLHGSAQSFYRINLTSGLWLNTNPLTSITIEDAGVNFAIGSRFSLMGVK
jgi:hypothetical protein